MITMAAINSPWFHDLQCLWLHPFDVVIFHELAWLQWTVTVWFYCSHITIHFYNVAILLVCHSNLPRYQESNCWSLDRFHGIFRKKHRHRVISPGSENLRFLQGRDCSIEVDHIWSINHLELWTTQCIGGLDQWVHPRLVGLGDDFFSSPVMWGLWNINPWKKDPVFEESAKIGMSEGSWTLRKVFCWTCRFNSWVFLRCRGTYRIFHLEPTNDWM